MLASIRALKGRIRNITRMEWVVKGLSQSQSGAFPRPLHLVTLCSFCQNASLAITVTIRHSG